MKKYKTTIIIEIDENELIEEQELEDETDIENACYEAAQEVALQMENIGEDLGHMSYFADSILYVDEII